jgi:hypothetical protein
MTRSTTETSRDFGHRGRQRGQILTHNLAVSRRRRISYYVYVYYIQVQYYYVCILVNRRVGKLSPKRRSRVRLKNESNVQKKKNTALDFGKKCFDAQAARRNDSL